MPDGTARRTTGRSKGGARSQGNGAGGLPELRAPRRPAAAGKPRQTAKAAPSKGAAARGQSAKGTPRKTAKGRGTAAAAGGRRRTGGKAKTRRQRPLWVRIATWSLVVLLWGMLAVGGLALWYSRDLPDIDQFAQQTRNASVTLVAADGSTLVSYGDLYGQSLRLEEISPWVSKAVIAIEDRRFYDHFGIDIWGLARALFINLSEGELRQGGSTITQQLAKILFLTPERSLKRKVQEAILAIQLEGRYSKTQILTLYLNRVYLGAGTYGVDAAARRYFGKSARDLDLYEAAMIAGLLKAPSRYNPANDQAGADARTRLVLDAMVDAGFIERATAEQAFAAKASGQPPVYDSGRHFADWALSQVGGYLGKIGRDVVVETTLDPRIQRIAEAALADLLAEQGTGEGASEGAVVVMRPDGRLLAMVGGRDYQRSEFNRATQALRQPGSAFKLFVFLAGLEAGLLPDSRFVDQPVTIGGWSPENYNERYYGEVTLREAFARSLNSVAVQLLQRAGTQKVYEAARRLGITTALPKVPALALGAGEVSLLELTASYAVFANQGYGVWPYGLESVRGTEGTTLYRRQASGLARVVAPEIVERMSDLLRGVVVWGTGKAADPGRPAAGKTGTSQDFRDAWFLGYTAELVVGVWIGNDDGSPMDKVTGGSLPARVFQRVVSEALDGQPVAALPGGGQPAAGDPPTSGPDEDVIANILESLEEQQEAPPAAILPLPRMEQPDAGGR